MKRRWVVLGTCVAIALAVGFQQVEPLHELRKHGSLHQGVGHGVGAEEYSFVPAGMAGQPFVDSLAALTRCPSVRELVVPKMANLEDTLSRVAKVTHVLSLRMRGIMATDDDVSALAGMKNLEHLDLSDNPNVTDAGVAALAGLENLRYLNLTNTSVTGAGFKHRADMVSLYQLTLNDCPVTDESLAAIPHFPKLEELLLGRTNVTDKGLMSLIGWYSLRRVTRTAQTTKAGSKAFNEAFLAARRNAREAGEQMDARDIPPVFLDNWRE
jgi:hypothetical protein